MKKILILLSIIFLIVELLTLSKMSANAQLTKKHDCLFISGKLTTYKWDTKTMGNGMMVGCAGDKGTAGCSGQVAKVAPNGEFALNRCTCNPFGDTRYNRNGCLVIGKNLEIRDYSVDGHIRTRVYVNDANDDLPNYCKLIVKSKEYSNTSFFPTIKQYDDDKSVTFCGTNDKSITGNFTIDCNRAPSAINDSYSTTIDIPLTVTTPGVLNNDTDPDKDTLTANLVKTTTNGTLTLNSVGSFTYAPNAGYKGIDTFTYKANDGRADSSNATVTISVNSFPSQPPQASINSVSVNEGQTAIFTISLSAQNPNPVSLTAVTSDQSATAPLDYISKTQNLTFAPGETIKTFSVITKTDATPDDSETFSVRLINPINVKINNSGVGTILDTSGPGSGYSIEGNIFLDNDGDGIKDQDESNFLTPLDLSINITGQSDTTANGKFLFNNLANNSYVVSLINIPTGYNRTTSISRTGLTLPCLGNPTSYNCDSTSGSISELNFGIQAEKNPWIQCVGGNCMLHGKNPTPQTCSSNNYTSIRDTSSEVGLILTTPSSFSFCPTDGSPCQELASTKQWVVGLGENYTYEGQSGTDFNTLKANATEISNFAQISESGKYLLTGNQTLTSNLVFPGKYVILIQGDLSINTNNIVVPEGSVLLFSVSGNIVIDKNVTNLQGWYSADDKIVINGDTDTNLNSPLVVEGALITNERGSGFVNERDLGATDNTTCPASVTINQRLDFILNAPFDLGQARSIWREIAP